MRVCGLSFHRRGRATAIWLSLFLSLTAVATWAGSEPWKSKPYQEWDSKDIRKIVNDSPWAKIVHLEALWENAPGADDSAGSVPMGGVRPGMGGNMGGQPSAPSDPRGSGHGSQVRQAAFLVRWVSSRTIREALLRSAVLSGTTKEEEAEKELARPVDTYQVFITGPDMKPFVGLDGDELKRGTFLLTRNGKRKITPGNVQIERTKDGIGVQAVVFLFPRKSQSGESTIAADEKGVDFTCVAGPARIQATFDILKMDDAQGRDL